MDPLRLNDDNGGDDAHKHLLRPCRACGSTDAAATATVGHRYTQQPQKFDLFASDGGRLAVLYTGCTGLQCSADDGLPPALCAVCHAKLGDFHAFRVRCAQWDERFRQQHLYLQQQLQTTTTTKPEPSDNPIVLRLQIKDEQKEVDPSSDDLNNADDRRPHDDDDNEDYNTHNDDRDNNDDPKPPPTRRPPAASSSSSSSLSAARPRDDELAAAAGLTDGRVQCDICKSFLRNRRAITKHMNDKHMHDNRCTWPGCGRLFPARGAMRKHVRQVHERAAALAAGRPVAPEPPRRLFVCEQCGKQFGTNAALHEHRFSHRPREEWPHACTLCPKRFVKKMFLNHHLLRHAGIKNHECPECGMRKTTRKELRNHMNFHTKARQWVCEHCAKVFTHIGNYQRHVRIVHEGVRAFACTYCEMTFGKAETLKHHVMTHTGERPWGCEECGMRFIQKTAMQTHMKTHQRRREAA